MGTVKYTGPVASFHCPTNAEIRSLKVHFSPKQEGSGDPSPENVRPIVGWDGVSVLQSGKNLLDTSKIYQSSDTQVVLGQNSGRYHWEIFLKAGTYTISTLTSINANVYISRKSIDQSSSNLGNTNTSLTVVLDIDDWCEFFIYKPAPGITITDIISFQLEVNQATTPYESYRGETVDYEFGVLGKNKFDAETMITDESYYIKEDGSLVANNLWRLTDYIPITGRTVTLSHVGGNAPSIALYDKDKNFIGAKKYNTGDALIYSNITITVNSDASFCRFSVYSNNAAWLNGTQLELGSTATAYEPYDPNHTMYGGWVDLITGEVQEEYKLLDKPWSEWGNKTVFEDGTELRYINFETPVKGNGISNFKTSLCNVAKYLYGNENGTTHYYIVGNSYNCRVYLPTGTDEDTQIQVLGELVTPITYHLAPTQLQTFLGQNNVWSNADYVEVEYDLHETQDILARKQFIVANQPHLVSPAAAPLQNFVTDMVAPLKECKVYFSPVQEGSGDASPENVRNISGWNGIIAGKASKNLLDVTLNDRSSYTATNGTVSINYVGSGNGTRVWFSQIFSAGTYTISCDYSGEGTNGPRLLCSQFISNSTWNNSYQGYWKNFSGRSCTFTTEKPFSVGLVFISRAEHNGEPGIFYNIQLELGSTATAYEPYNGTTIPITFPSEVGTVYGGYVDLVAGKVVQTHYPASVLKSQFGNQLTPSSGGMPYRQTVSLFPDTASGTNWVTARQQQIFNYGKIANPWSETTYGSYVGVIITQGANGTYMRISEDIYQALSDDDRVEICYELATPITYQIDQTTLKTLRGTNNIWASNGGDNIELSYWAH